MIEQQHIQKRSSIVHSEKKSSPVQPAQEVLRAGLRTPLLGNADRVQMGREQYYWREADVVLQGMSCPSHDRHI